LLLSAHADTFVYIDKKVYHVRMVTVILYTCSNSQY